MACKSKKAIIKLASSERLMTFKGIPIKKKMMWKK